MTAGHSGPLVLMYHRIGWPRRRCKTSGQYVGARAFAHQMALLRLLRAPVVPVDEVAQHVRGEKQLTSRHLAITFDDGFGNLYSNAFPVLRKYNYSATIFLISQYIGRINTYHPPEDEIYEPLLSAEQIFEMQAECVSFGSHTRRHAKLTSCSPEALVEEITGSREDLENMLHRQVTSFCYPYGAQNDTVREAVINAGYTLACSTLKGCNLKGEDPYRLRRINVRADTWLPVFLYKLARARYFNR